MPAILRFDQQSVCASRRFRDYGKPDVSGGGRDFPRSARAVPERSDEDAGRAGDAFGTRSGSAGGNAGGESRQAHPAYAGLPKSHGNIDATGIAPQITGVGRTPPGSGSGGSQL